MLLGLDWTIDMGGIIKLKIRSMIFEIEGTRVIVPLDPAEGKRYTEPVREDEDFDHIYSIGEMFRALPLLKVDDHDLRNLTPSRPSLQDDILKG